jgi:hypothetical protein
LRRARSLPGRLERFGYRQADDADVADRRNFYKVEKWDAVQTVVVRPL